MSDSTLLDGYNSIIKCCLKLEDKILYPITVNVDQCRNVAIN